MDDETLIESLLADPPRREQLPRCGGVGPTPTEARRRQRLFRALSITDHAPVRELLTSGLTEPFSRERGSLDEVPLASTPEAARMARWAIAQGWPLEAVRERMLGLLALHESLDHTAPDTWRVAEVAETLCNWHRARQPVSEIYRGILAAEALWSSDECEIDWNRMVHFRNFLGALEEVF